MGGAEVERRVSSCRSSFGLWCQLYGASCEKKLSADMRVAILKA